MLLFWPLIAKAAGAILGGGGGGGLLGGLLGGGGAGGAAAGGIGGAAGGGGGIGGLLGGMMGGGGGGQGKSGGGMMDKVKGMMPHNQIMGGVKELMAKGKNPENVEGPAMQRGAHPGYSGGGKLKYNVGGGIDPSFFEYLSKLTGQEQGQGGPEIQLPENFMQVPADPGMTATDPSQGTVANSPADTPAQNMGMPMPGQENKMPTIPASMTADPATQPATAGGNQVSQLATPDGKYETDERGITKVPESGEAMKDAAGKLKSGNIIGAAMGMTQHIMEKRGAKRRQMREEQQWEGQMEQAMKHGSVYNDKNSVYYAAKDGAAIPSTKKQNNNLVSMMAYKGGGKMPEYFGGGMLKGILPFQNGGLSLPGEPEKKALGEEEDKTGKAPKYVGKGKSYHYNPNSYLGEMAGVKKNPKVYRRTLGDMMFDVFHPNQPARVKMKF